MLSRAGDCILETARLSEDAERHDVTALIGIAFIMMYRLRQWIKRVAPPTLISLVRRQLEAVRSRMRAQRRRGSRFRRWRSCRYNRRSRLYLHTAAAGLQCNILRIRLWRMRGQLCNLLAKVGLRSGRQRKLLLNLDGKAPILALYRRSV